MAGDIHRTWQQILKESDPVKRDVLLGIGEAARIGALTRDINNAYGDPTQDPTAVHLVSGTDCHDDPTTEAHWEGLVLTREYPQAGHGWPATGPDPIAGA